MKFLAFHVRPDEENDLKQWSQNQQIQVDYNHQPLTPETVELAAGYDGISALQTIKYEASVFDKMAALGIKFLAVRNVGVDNVDLAAAEHNGILVTNVPAYSPEAIAEFAVTLSLNLLRQMGEVNASIARDEFTLSPKFKGFELQQQVVGIVGAGRIGQAAIKIFKGFGAKVIAFDPGLPAAIKAKLGVQFVETLPELLQQATLISLHLPGGRGYLLSTKEFAQMQPGTILINCARGSLVDTQALLAAIKSGQLAGAALDTYEYENQALATYEHEKTVTDPLILEMRQLPNVILTPHMAFYTDISVKNMVNISLNSLKALVETGTAETLVQLEKD